MSNSIVRWCVGLLAVALAMAGGASAVAVAGEPVVLDEVAWAVDFEGLRVRGVHLGREVIYIEHEVSNQWSPPTRHPLTVDDRPLINDTGMRYDGHCLVTCIDGETGRARWTRTTAGLIHKVVDPRTDDLLMWGEHLYCLDAKGGGVERTLPVQTEKPNFVFGALVEGEVLKPPSINLISRREADVVDWRSGEVGSVSLAWSGWESLDGRSRVGLEEVPAWRAGGEGAGEVVRPVLVAEGERVPSLGNRMVGPLVFGDELGDALIVGVRPPGGRRSSEPVRVMRFDLATLQPVWEHVCEEGIYPVSAPAKFEPLGWLDRWRVGVLSGGSLRLLDIRSGEVVAVVPSTPPSTPGQGEDATRIGHHAFPRIIAGRVVIVTTAGLRAVRLDRLPPPEP